MPKSGRTSDSASSIHGQGAAERQDGAGHARAAQDQLQVVAVLDRATFDPATPRPAPRFPERRLGPGTCAFVVENRRTRRDERSRDRPARRGRRRPARRAPRRLGAMSGCDGAIRTAGAVVRASTRLWLTSPVKSSSTRASAIRARPQRCGGEHDHATAGQHAPRAGLVGRRPERKKTAGTRRRRSGTACGATTTRPRGGSRCPRARTRQCAQAGRPCRPRARPPPRMVHARARGARASRSRAPPATRPPPGRSAVTTAARPSRWTSSRHTRGVTRAPTPSTTGPGHGRCDCRDRWGRAGAVAGRVADGEPSGQRQAGARGGPAERPREGGMSSTMPTIARRPRT